MTPISLFALIIPGTALAGADVQTTLTVPTSADVYASASYTVDVDNIGNRHANNVDLVIQLPETNTSPTVHVMGTLDSYDSRCTEVGTTLQCSLGRIRKGQGTTVAFSMSLPQSAAPLELVATADAADANPGNDSDADAVDLLFFDYAISGPETASLQHCTGTDLTAFFECTLYPSSLSGHSAQFDAGGTISFPGGPAGYAGTWSQSSDDHLEFTYTDNGTPVVEFVGDGVGGACFEGLTEFPQNPPWVSPYEVCF